MNKYNSSNVRNKYGQGWFLESHRHSLARQGIKTGRKVNYSKKLMKNVFIVDEYISPGNRLTHVYKDRKKAKEYAGEDFNVEKGNLEINYYKISSISDKDKLQELQRDINERLKEKGYNVFVSIKDDGSINLSDLHISEKRIQEKGHNIQQKLQFGEGKETKYKRTRALSWDDWVEVNDTVNDILDEHSIKANVKSLGGKFDIRDKTEGRRTETDWTNLQEENVGSIMYPITRSDYIITPEEATERGIYLKKSRSYGGDVVYKEIGKKPEKKGTKFVILQPSGEVTKQMTIDINKVKSDDPLAYSYGYFQAKSGQPMSKDKGLAKEYIRGYKDFKAGKKIDYAYTAGDLPGIVTTGLGTAGATAVEWIPPLIAVGATAHIVKKVRKMAKKRK